MFVLAVHLIFDSHGEEIKAQCLNLTVHLGFCLVIHVISVFLRTSSVSQNDGSWWSEGLCCMVDAQDIPVETA
jgi:hypothetical protein